MPLSACIVKKGSHLIDYPVCSMRRWVMQSGASIMYIYTYITKIARLASSRSNNSWKSVCGAFLLHLHVDVVNVSWQSIYSRSSAISVSLLALVHSLGVAGAPGVHTCAHWLVGVLLRLPQCWLDATPATNCSVLLVAAVCCWWLQCAAGICSAASISLTCNAQCAQGTCVLWNSSFLMIFMFNQLCGWFPLLSFHCALLSKAICSFLAVAYVLVKTIAHHVIMFMLVNAQLMCNCSRHCHLSHMWI